MLFISVFVHRGKLNDPRLYNRRKKANKIFFLQSVPSVKPALTYFVVAALSDELSADFKYSFTFSVNHKIKIKRFNKFKQSKRITE